MTERAFGIGVIAATAVGAILTHALRLLDRAMDPQR